jgi:hypothetical protein
MSPLLFLILVTEQVQLGSSMSLKSKLTNPENRDRLLGHIGQLLKEKKNCEYKKTWL